MMSATAALWRQVTATLAIPGMALGGLLTTVPGVRSSRGGTPGSWCRCP